MNGFIVMLLVFLLTLVLVIAEEMYVYKTSDILLEEFNFEAIENTDDLNMAVEHWEETERFLKYFVNHKELEKITLEIKSAEVCFLKNETILFMNHLERARVMIKNLPQY